MVVTTAKESWKLACNNCSGSQSNIRNPAAQTEFNRSTGLLSYQPATMIDIMIVALVADACQPVAWQ